MDDIGGHWGTYVPLARPAPPENALPGAPRKSAPARSRTGIRRARNANRLPNSNTSPFTRGSSPSSHAACSDAYVTLTRSGTARCRRLRSMKCSGLAQRENVHPVGMDIVAGVYCSRSARHDNGEKAPDAIRMLRDDGWELVRTKGSHRQYRHPTKIGRVTVAGHGRDDLKPKTWNSILKQAGLPGGN